MDTLPTGAIAYESRIIETLLFDIPRCKSTPYKRIVYSLKNDYARQITKGKNNPGGFLKNMIGDSNGSND
jgi:hypothetical protein